MGIPHSKLNYLQMSYLMD